MPKSPNVRHHWRRASDFRMVNSTVSRRPVRTGGSAILFGRKPGIGIELEESAFRAGEGPDRYSSQSGCLRARPKRLLRLACLPAGDQNRAVGIIRNEPLNHVTLAFGTPQFVVSHGPIAYLGVVARANIMACPFWNVRWSAERCLSDRLEYTAPNGPGARAGACPSGLPIPGRAAPPENVRQVLAQLSNRWVCVCRYCLAYWQHRQASVLAVQPTVCHSLRWGACLLVNPSNPAFDPGF